MTMDKKTHVRRVKVDKKTRDTRIKRLEANRGDMIEFVAEDGGIWVIIPDTDLYLRPEPPVAESVATDLWFAFRLEAGHSAVIEVPGDYPPFVPDPVDEPGVVGTKEVYYLVICGSPGDAYPATGNSPPRMIIPPSPMR
jgi:signal peptidase I